MYPKYPVGNLISEAIEKKNIKNSDLLRAVGYRNINRGMRRLNACITGKKINREFLNKLAQILEIDEQILNDAIKETKIQKKRKKEEYERRHFKPHIYIQHSLSRPRSITAVCFIGLNSFKRIALPVEISKLSDEDQIEMVVEIAKKHYKRTKNEGSMFGRVTGYIYRKTYDESIEFSVDGQVLGKSLEKIREPKATLKIGNRIIEGGIGIFQGRP